MAEKNQTPASGGAKKSSSKPDIGTIGGIAMALGGILGGLILEKGQMRDISQSTAAMIVLGGTFGATLVNTPLETVMGALRRLAVVFFSKTESAETLVEEILHYATKARKNGLVSLESEVASVSEPFLQRALTLAVDGTDLQEIRKMMDLAIGLEEHRAESEAKVFECAGGYAPTIGIIGAVLGLIQVMKNLTNIDEVGHGIATAFVATVYGVAVANLFLLPAANKIKARVHHQLQMRELIVEGVSGIVEGLNPKLIRSKLEAYAHPSAGKKKAADKKAAEAQPAGA